MFLCQTISQEHPRCHGSTKVDLVSRCSRNLLLVNLGFSSWLIGNSSTVYFCYTETACPWCPSINCRAFANSLSVLSQNNCFVEAKIVSDISDLLHCFQAIWLALCFWNGWACLYLWSCVRLFSRNCVRTILTLQISICWGNLGVYNTEE